MNVSLIVRLFDLVFRAADYKNMLELNKLFIYDK